MWTIIILSIIGALIVSWGFFMDNEYIWGILFGFIGLLLGCLFGILVAVIIPSEMTTVKTTYKLESIQDNRSVNGSFFLGSGNINGSMKYVFYYEENGFYKMEQVDYSKVKIKYVDSNHIAERFDEIQSKDAFINNFSLGFTYCKGYIIYVPKGTIKNNYTLDAQ